MITSIGLTIFFIGLTYCQNCDVNTRCAPYIDSIPECTPELENDHLYKCLMDMLKDCHLIPKAPQLKENVKLARDIFCKDKNLANSFNRKPECWKKMKSCVPLEEFGDFRRQIAQSAKGKEDICKLVKSAKDKCLSYASTECKEMQTKYINIAYDEILCKQDSEGTSNDSSSKNIQNLISSILSVVIVYTLQ